jgi:L-fuconolactonase
VSRACAPDIAVIRVDAHHHLWDPTKADYPWLTDELAAINRAFTIDDLRSATAAAEIDATVLVQTRADINETAEFLQSGSPVAGVVGWVDLTAAGVDDAIAELREAPNGHRLVGIRHQVHDEADPNWLDRTDVRHGLDAVASAGLVFDLLVRARELPAATRLAAAMPHCQFVLDHLAKPPLNEPHDSPARTHWAHELAAIAVHANVSAKISGLVTEAEWKTWTPNTLRPATDVALDVFGPDRLMFGSDWPVCLVAASYTQVIDAFRTLIGNLSAVEQESVFGTNAQRIYGLQLRTARDDPRP